MPGAEEGAPRNVQRLSMERPEYVLEELVSKHQKTIIYCRFHEDINMLMETAKVMGFNAVEFSGRLSDKQCELNKLAFQSEDISSPHTLVATTGSGGEALNLQIANRTIYYSNSYNYGHRIQSTRRTWRAGQEQTCYYFDIFGFPIDRLIWKNLIDKRDLAAQLKLATDMAKLVDEI
jgi:SNF2 family DNA or RNA helicase